jgi:outer membrane immunogenic protein
MVVRIGAWRRVASFVVGGLLGLMLLGPSGPAIAGDSGREHETAWPGNWSGVYIGAHGGYGWAEADYTFDTWFGPEKFKHDANNGLFGGHLGVQQQYGRIVAGLEISYSDLDFSDTVESAIVPNRFRTLDIDSLFTATARLGLARDHWLAYVKGGYASADVDTAVFIGGTAGSSDTSGRADGWTIGGGLEFNCFSRFILGLEYDYVKLDVDDRTGILPDLKPFYYKDVDAEIQSVVARVSYKFGHDPAPAPLK